MPSISVSNNVSPRIKRKDVIELLSSYPGWAHPDVHYWEDNWQMLRDTVMGEREMKDNARRYLPQPSGMEDDDYVFFLDNATYFNMTSRTLGALVGTIFRRNPMMNEIPARLKNRMKKISKKKQSFRTFSRRACREVIQMGRFGVLVDMPSGGGDAFLVGYKAEAMLDWRTDVIEGREELTSMVLMEIAEQDDRNPGTPRQFDPVYRVLRLVPSVATARGWQYEQHIYTVPGSSGQINLEAEPDEVIVPLNRGKPLDFIPFKVLGPDTNDIEVEKSPLYDIAAMNVSHYRSYGQLEHGRFYTGLPIYWVSVNDAGESGEYRIGPSMVWEITSGQKAGLLEFNGQGLKFLETAIANKEAHIATLGGRLVGVTTASVSESDNQVAMKDRNEHAMLLAVAMAMDEGFTEIIQWWAAWMDTPEGQVQNISIEFNKDFILKEVAAREFRAMHMMYTDGLIPIEVFFDYMSRAEVIPEWMELPEFKRLIATSKSFPMQPDAEARENGYPNKQSEIDDEQAEKELKADEEAAAREARALAQARQQQMVPPDDDE